MILEIAITGLTAFIRDKCAADEATKLNVLTMSGPAGMAHHPRLIIEAKYVRPSNNEEEWPDEAISLPDGTQYMIWDLTGYGVEIPNAPPIAIYEGHRVPKANPTRAWEKDKADFGPHPKSDPPEDISWIPDIDRACGRGG